MAYINELIWFSVGQKKKKKKLMMGLGLAMEAHPFSTGQTKLTSYEAQARLRNWLKSTTPVIAMQLYINVMPQNSCSPTKSNLSKEKRRENDGQGRVKTKSNEIVVTPPPRWAHVMQL